MQQLRQKSGVLLSWIAGSQSGQGSQRSHRPITTAVELGLACSSVATFDYLDTELLPQGTKAGEVLAESPVYGIGMTCH